MGEQEVRRQSVVMDRMGHGRRGMERNRMDGIRRRGAQGGAGWVGVGLGCVGVRWGGAGRDMGREDAGAQGGRM